MRAYELMLIINPTLGEEKTEAVIEKVKGIIENNNGQIEKLDKWGTKKLAYEVKDFNEGYYVVTYYKAEPTLAAELDRLLKINEEVLKHMILSVEE